MAQQQPLPDETDVLVVGAGIIGTSTAFRLASETDRDVTLVDRDNVAAGATGDSSAILRQQYYGNELYAEMARRGRELYETFEEETGEPLATADSPLVGFLKNGTESAARFERGADVIREMGLSASTYDRAELEARYPMFEFPEEVDYAVSDDEAAYSDGTDAASGFARAAQDAGATLVTGVAVESIATEDGVVVGAETDAGRIDCDDVVLAAGRWSGQIAETVGVDLPILPSREQILLLQPPEDVTQEELETIPTTGSGGFDWDVHWYFRPDFGGKIYMGTHQRSEFVDPDDYDRDPDEEMVLNAVEFLSEVVPRLADAKIIGQFCGVYANTPDNEFIIDQVGPDGCYALVGAGHAFKHGPVIGQLAKDLVVDGESDLFDLDEFRLDRFDGKPTDEIYAESL
ncbi:FAD-binding oxidoreductase [Haloarculaceae archaeon H-GB2-1]|nr:FAD-binding oxidoreductase [Haloarculaceae archaeon H-GB1-1]MEA5387916.1 FAD-binding oxidoreductase [Haloarculaceae archaeon H-GB11]MEA5409411.1 FAD-binding oxidoreductase [Haloarculaceae archaeon H-GB2-1]